MSNKPKWNNCSIKNNSEILFDLTDYALQEQPEDNLMVDISRLWYNGSYTMATKPIKSLKLHYTTEICLWDRGFEFPWSERFLSLCSFGFITCNVCLDVLSLIIILLFN